MCHRHADAVADLAHRRTTIRSNKPNVLWRFLPAMPSTGANHLGAPITTSSFLLQGHSNDSINCFFFLCVTPQQLCHGVHHVSLRKGLLLNNHFHRPKTLLHKRLGSLTPPSAISFIPMKSPSLACSVSEGLQTVLNCPCRPQRPIACQCSIPQPPAALTPYCPVE